MNNNTKKTLILGLDSMTFKVLDPLREQNLCPNLDNLIKTGVHGDLESVPNMNSIPAWSSFMTGKNPGKHGLYWFYERKKNSYDFKFCSGGDIEDRRYWEILEENRFKTGTVNVPMTYPASGVNGFLISGLDAPGEKSERFTYPENLYQEIREEVGDYHIDTNILGYARGGNMDKAIEATNKVIDSRLNAFKYLIKEKEWDILTVVFTALDRIQHTFWHFMDEEHPDFDPSKASAYGDVIEDFYKRLDEVLGEILDIVPDDTNVILVSDHGAGFNQMGNMYLQPLLEALGLFVPEKKNLWNPKLILKKILHILSGLADKFLSKRLRRNVMCLLPGGRSGLVSGLHQQDARWDETKAYTSYIRPEIWLNVKGREPKGIVDENYEEIRDFIIDKLYECRDIKTGNKLVEKVYKREEVYSGKHVEKAPDIVVKWCYDGIISGLKCTDKNGEEVLVENPDNILERKNISGDQRPEGVLIASGNKFKSNTDLENAKLEDIAPTILHLMESPVPEDMDGEVLTGAFKDGFMENNPIEKISPSGTSEPSGEQYTDEE